MKHKKCYGRDREMNLVWQCGKCGEEICAEEFEEDDLVALEFALNALISQHSEELEMMGQVEAWKELIEKVRKM